jgi:hypothetical protein
MLKTEPISMVEQPYEQTLARVTGQLSALGLRVLVTFDLQASRLVDIGCSCPHRCTEDCSCRMSVLLVYGKSSEPASLLLQGHESKTWFSMVDTPQQPLDPQLREEIRSIIAPVFSR